MARRDDREAMAGRTRITVHETTPARRGRPRRLAALAATAALWSALVVGAALGHGRMLAAPTAPPVGGAIVADGAHGHTIWDDRLDRRDALSARALWEAGPSGVGPK